MLRVPWRGRLPKVSRLTHGRGIILKSRREIELIRRAGRVVYRVLRRMEELAGPGVTTAALNAAAEEMIAKEGGTPLFKGVKNPQAKFPFPAALCTSVNEELVHGIPSDRALREGDIVSVDCGVRLDGYCGDSATTIAIGQVSPAPQHLLKGTRRTVGVAMWVVGPR